MEEKKEMLELMKKLEETSRKQAAYARLQCLFTLITALCFVGMAVMLYRYLPQIAAMIGQMQSLMKNLEQVTKELSAIDFESMIAGINTLVDTGQFALEQSVNKLNTIDFETLNKGIRDLADVVEPLARFFNTFK